MTDAGKETLGFKTEVKQLLHLMIHSLYSNKEIFLRELISNASDGCDKLRFEALQDSGLYEGESDLKVTISADNGAGTVTIEDNGIGMNRDDVINNLGTIARSGTAEFLSKLSGDQKKDSQLIGQFGVGFYSAFIVADRVVVETRRAGESQAQGVRWESAGEGEFSLEPVDKAVHGTRITLHLKDGESEFLEPFRLESLIKKYSDHIAIPVFVEKEKAEGEEDKPAGAVNQAQALWTRAKSDVSDEDYKEFYKHVSHDWNEPLTWMHNRVEGTLDYTSLLYIPAKAPFDIWNRDATRGLKLYVQRVFIMDDAEQFLPLYLRFVKGVLDSNDLSLNVSREILQKDKQVENLRSALVKRVLDTLEKMAKKDPEKYQSFWDEFGDVLKEGPAEDFSNREKIAGLFRFSSTHTGEDIQNVALADYVSRMREGQKKIYYVTGDSYAAASASPHLEYFRRKGVEVLVLTDRVDEWMVGHLSEFGGKAFQDITKGELDLEDLADDAEKEQQKQLEETHKDLVSRIQEALKEDVKEVRVTSRLTDSPACMVVGQYDMNAHMRRMMEAAGQSVPEPEIIMEVNPEHPLVTRMDQEQDEERFADLANLIHAQAQLAEGSQLRQPAEYVSRINKLLLDLMN